MILGVMSDTHGNMRMMHDVASRMAGEFGATHIVHLGDDYQDGEALGFAGYDVWVVPGLWCPEYHNPRIPRRLCEPVEGMTLVAMHAERDLRPLDRQADMVLLGHTHVARLEHIDNSLFVNPGHLRAPTDRGECASFAVLEVTAGSIRARIVEVVGGLRQEMEICRV